jgi:CheY-like chemotaxis protein
VPAPIRAVKDVATAGLMNLGGLNVLAVDDDQDALVLLGEILAAAGAAVATANSTDAALDQIQRECPDVLVADLGMPERDGFELIEAVRGSRDARLRAIPAAALTAYARSDDRRKALEKGFDVHLPKPVDPAELVGVVAALAARRAER